MPVSGVNEDDDDDDDDVLMTTTTVTLINSTSVQYMYLFFCYRLSTFSSACNAVNVIMTTDTRIT